MGLFSLLYKVLWQFEGIKAFFLPERLPKIDASNLPGWFIQESKSFIPQWFIVEYDLEKFITSVYFGEQQTQLLRDAEFVLNREYTFLGTTHTNWLPPYSWRKDVLSGYVWPKQYFKLILIRLSGRNGADVKIPWEISRFQYLTALGKSYWVTRDEMYASTTIEFLSNWMEENPYKFGVNWTCSMEVAIRACNWLWGYFFFRQSANWTETFNRRFWNSLWQHGCYIAQNLEKWGKATQNHYLADIVGLLFLGVMGKDRFPEAGKWKDFALQEIICCMAEQIYPDGVDFENSINYHRLVLEFFSYSAILARQNNLELPQPYWDRLEKMFEFVAAYIRPDGRAPHFGDSDDGRFFIFENYSSWDRWDHRYLLSIGAVLFSRSDFKAIAGSFHEEAFWLLGEKGRSSFNNIPVGESSPQSRLFPDGGICFLRSEQYYVAVNASNAGVNGTGPHKHNDALHFDLSVDDQPVLLDSGTFCYTGDPSARNKFRSTAAHNTLLIDGVEQNDIETDLFQLKKDQTHVKINRWVSTPIFDLFDIEHDAYQRLALPVIHRRIFLLNKRQQSFYVIDKVIGMGMHNLALFFHFAPGSKMTWTCDGTQNWKGTIGRIHLELRTSSPMEFNLLQSQYSEVYNRSILRPVLRVSGDCLVDRFTSIFTVTLDDKITNI